MAEHGLGVLVVGCFAEVHYMNAGSGHVVDVEEFALRRATAPDGDLRSIGHLGFVEAAYEGWDDVGVF